MAYTCTITKQVTASAAERPTAECKIQVVCTAVTDFTDKGLFLAQEVAGVTSFISVCTTGDLTTYLLNKADPVSGYKRVESFSTTLSSFDVAETALASLELFLARLCDAKTKLEVLSTPVSVTIGA